MVSETAGYRGGSAGGDNACQLRDLAIANGEEGELANGHNNGEVSLMVGRAIANDSNSSISCMFSHCAACAWRGIFRRLIEGILSLHPRALFRRCRRLRRRIRCRFAHRTKTRGSTHSN
ncbi:hypothetical protein L1987_24388 [Smallanthus sonchifolius]|uniref:Uncharacterized protein n=1 Tax=Smallanthus sonchifolius TaxID=185202 RepID=A0ACB9IMZ0_9ASTR|nr:hypothetical protein L1987_24388 [Smallanthus sonchifolius]